MDFSDFLLMYYEWYTVETKHYKQTRGAGLYAVLNWALRSLSLLEMKGNEVESIELYLTEYARELEVFNSLFEIKKFDTNLSKLSESEKIEFLNNTISSNVGLSENPMNLNLDITNKIISKYFNPKKEVVEWYNKFIDELGCDVKDIILVWARRTDKISESRIPTVSDYISKLSKIDKTNKVILIQTDDEFVVQEFKDKHLGFKTLTQIPFPNNRTKPFHIDLWSVSDEEFKEMYGISKIDHLRQMVAIALISKNCYKTILYPGNPTTFMPLFKGSFDDFILYKDEINLFKKQ